MVDGRPGDSEEDGIEFQEVIRRRRMVRNFDNRSLPAGTLDRLLRNSLKGPSAGFAQGFDLLVLEGPDQTERLWRASPPIDSARKRWSGVMNAPAIVIFLAHEKAYRDRFAEGDKSKVIDVAWWSVDSAFSAMIMLLGAVDAGLGALFFGVNDPQGVRREFDIPDEFDPIGAIAIGHPRPHRPSASVARGRRRFDEVVHRNSW